MDIRAVLFGEENERKKKEQGFNEAGLKFSNQHLINVLQKVIRMPIEKAAEYADYVTVNNLNEEWFIAMVKTEYDMSKSRRQQLNATSIGNISYVALHCKDEVVKAKAKELLSKIKK